MKSHGLKLFPIFLAFIGMTFGQTNVAFAKQVILRMDGGPAGSGKQFAQELLVQSIKKKHPEWRVILSTGVSSGAVIGQIGRGEADTVRSGLLTIYECEKGVSRGRKIKPLQLSWTLPLTIETATWILFDDIDINSVPEFMQKKPKLRIANGRKYAGPWADTKLILEKGYGLTFEDMEKWGCKLSYSGGGGIGKMMADHLIDATTGISAAPMSGIVDVSKHNRLKMFSYTEPDVVAKMKKFGFSMWNMPKGTYNFIKKDTPVMGAIQSLLVRRDMDEDVVYEMTKAIWEDRARLGSLFVGYKEFMRPEVIRELAEDHIDTMHPGARRYFVEQGILK